jgi:hypothetical protein
MKRLIIDLDETITLAAPDGQAAPVYEHALPNLALIARLREYRADGFERTADFTAACELALQESEDYLHRWGELYVAPLYNTLIEAGRHIVYDEAPASRVHFAGTPAEYGALVASHRSLP